MYTLMPLRIPTGWAVNWNGFFEQDEPDPSEDLLWMSRIVPAKARWIEWHIDLGWYRDRFALVAHPADWDRVYKRFETTDRLAAAREVERWLQVLGAAGEDPAPKL